MPAKKSFYRKLFHFTYPNLSRALMFQSHTFQSLMFQPLTFLALMFLALMLLSPVSHAQIYKWVDDNGQTHYGSKPQPNNQSVETVNIRKNTTTTPRISKEDIAIDTMNKKEAEAERERLEATRLPDVEQKIPAAEKRRLCKQAKNDYAGIMSRGRLRERNPSTGEYVYLSEKQRQQRLNATLKRQREYCR